MLVVVEVVRPVVAKVVVVVDVKVNCVVLLLGMVYDAVVVTAAAPEDLACLAVNLSVTW